MRKIFIHLTVLGSMLLLSACSAGSGMFDNSCTGAGGMVNADYCTKTLHPNAGPWAGK
jgi:hypothetical protein